MSEHYKDKPTSLDDKSNGELLSLMAVKIASLHLLAENGSPLLRANITEALTHLNNIYEKLLDDPRVMQDVGCSYVDLAREEKAKKARRSEAGQ